MYSGSLSARQSTNHNSRYRMLMDTCKFLSNLMKQIPRNSNHTCVHTNTWTPTCPPRTHLTGCVQHSSLSQAQFLHPLTSEGNADLPVLHRLVLLLVTPVHVRGRNPCGVVLLGNPAHSSWGH